MPKRVKCPKCEIDYANRRGVKKHLLDAHQLVFVAFSIEIHALSSSELAEAMDKL